MGKITILKIQILIILDLTKKIMIKRLIFQPERMNKTQKYKQVEKVKKNKIC
jgi:hypothetical protein